MQGDVITWWDALAQVGLLGFVAGVAGAAVAVLRRLPWGKDWNVGGYR